MKKFIIVLFVVLVLGAGVIHWKKNRVPLSPHSTTSVVVDESGWSPDYKNLIVSLTSPMGTKQSFSEAAKKQLADQTMSSFVMPSVGGSHIVFSTYHIDQSTWTGTACTSINRLYQYDVVSGALSEIYKEESRDGSPMLSGKCRILRTAGLADGKIVVLIDDPENSPGPCTSIWNDYKERFLVFDQASKTFEPFQVPAYKIDEGVEETQRCQEELQVQ